MRKLAMFLSFFCLVVVSAVTMSCGGSSKSTATSCTGGPYNVVGDWSITSSGNGGSSSGVGVINTAGQALFFQTSTSEPAPGDVIVLPTITGTCSFSGIATAYATPYDTGTVATGNVQGTVNSDTSISATIQDGNALSLAAISPLEGAPQALSSGGWNGVVEGASNADIWDLEFTPTGQNASMSVSGSNNQGCSIEGTFNQEGGDASTLNIFDVSLNFVLDNCPYSSISGLGFESNTDYFGVGGAEETHLYAISDDGAFVLEIFFVGDERSFDRR